jgi:hypothetical protein
MQKNLWALGHSKFLHESKLQYMLKNPVITSIGKHGISNTPSRIYNLAPCSLLQPNFNNSAATKNRDENEN